MRHIHGSEGKLTSCRILQGVRDLMAQVGKSVTTVTMSERSLPSECEGMGKEARPE